MIDISVTGLVKSFDLEKKILDGITFQIDTGERVGLLGKNGAGKTTLFRILTGELDYDAGEVSIASGRRLGLISQIPVYPEGYTVEDVLKSAFSRMQRMEDEMNALSQQMANGDESEETLRRYGELSAKFEGLGGYDTETPINKVANGLSIPPEMRERLFDTLSGGEKTRVNLGRLILEDTDILLLDEPTNHLDLHAIEWLEQYLSTFKGTVVAISHDRYFLDRTITRVIEVLDGKAEFYSGNYSFYAVEKERRYLEKMRQYEKEQAKLAQLGFTLEPFGRNDYILRGVPAQLDAADALPALEEICAQLRHGAQMDAQSVRDEVLKTVACKLLAGKTLDPNGLRDELLHSIACKSAIKAGWQTEPEELLRLADAVCAGEVKYCPHGRPVAVTLTRRELDKLFKRIV